MSTLDELKKQASDVTQRKQVGESVQVSDEQVWRQLAPVMKYLKAHFTDLANTLNVLEKDILVDFKINNSVTLKRVKAQNYKITHPSADKEKDFVFEFENYGQHPTYCLTHIGTAATAFKGTLLENQMQCVTTAVEGNKSVKFEIKSLVRTKYRFTANPAKENISLTITNYDSFWSQTNYFKRNDVTAELMDELTHHVMRESNKYNELVGNTVSDEARTKLRAKLQADITAKKAHAAKNEAAQMPAKKEKMLLGKFFKKK
ncbi:MAG: hypothetical protein ACI9SC_001833 [Gammaproteobacteria bacterium]|jgi:hypothetical protein